VAAAEALRSARPPALLADPGRPPRPAAARPVRIATHGGVRLETLHRKMPGTCQHAAQAAQQRLESTALWLAQPATLGASRCRVAGASVSSWKHSRSASDAAAVSNAVAAPLAGCGVASTGGQPS